MHSLKFKNVDLIQQVEQKPLLWEKACPHSSNKEMKDRAWLEIYNNLYPGFNQFSQSERKILGDSITTKWRNLRDAFIRSMKRKHSIRGRRYIYFDQLQFLLNRRKYRRNTAVTQSNIDYIETLSPENLQSRVPKMETMENFDLTTQPPEEEIISRQMNAAEETMQIQENSLMDVLVDVHQETHHGSHHESHHGPHHEIHHGPHHETHHGPQCHVCHEFDEDSSFFASIIPSIRNMDEDEKLDFRISTLELIRKIKQKRQASAQRQNLVPNRHPSGYLSSGDCIDLIKKEYK